MKIIIVEHDFLHLLKQHLLQQQHIQDNRLVVLLNQVNRLKINKIIFQFLLVESMCAVTEENNKKNATSECSEQRIILYVFFTLNLL
jgi:hypothetical protein